jgi:hypothetical protein
LICSSIHFKETTLPLSISSDHLGNHLSIPTVTILIKNLSGDFGLGITNLALFIGSTVLSVISFLNLYMTAHANHWSWQSKLVVGLYGLITFGMRLFAILQHFIPSLVRFFYTFVV